MNIDKNSTAFKAAWEALNKDAIYGEPLDHEDLVAALEAYEAAREPSTYSIIEDLKRLHESHEKECEEWMKTATYWRSNAKLLPEA